jgi:hypothetical protein
VQTKNRAVFSINNENQVINYISSFARLVSNIAGRASEKKHLRVAIELSGDIGDQKLRVTQRTA